MGRQASGILAAAAAAALMVTACGGRAAQGPARVAAVVCPAKPPPLAMPARQASPGALVPPGTVIASEPARTPADRPERRDRAGNRAPPSLRHHL